MITPYMSMPSPNPTQTVGPDWAYDIAACISIVDSHNHSSGQGVQIQPNGLDISSDLAFQANNATELRSTRFESQAAVLALSTDIGCLYVVGNELYYNDYTGGHNVQITTNGSVNSGAGSITGLPSGTASASYSGGVFTWQSATNTAANMDFASAIFRNATASSKGLTLQPPAAMGADFTLTLPSIPGTTNIMSLDTGGNMAAAINVDNATLQLSSNTLAVKALGVGTAQLANASVTAAKLAGGAVTPTILTYTSNDSLTVPAGVTVLELLVAGGGGGGGGGGGDATGSGNVNGAGAGGGGGGCVPQLARIVVAPGDTVGITIGAGGTAGTAGAATSGSGGAGGNGGSTIITVNAVTVLTALGALGGGGGVGGTGAAGGSGGGIGSYAAPVCNGGAGGGFGTGVDGYASIYGAGGLGRANSGNGGSGGGGGAAAYGAGVNGGVGGAPGGATSGGGAGGNAANATARGGGGGGGGGGRHGSGNNAGGTGGTGMGGVCVISYF